MLIKVKDGVGWEWFRQVEVGDTQSDEVRFVDSSEVESV
jgi:hypothetical protein